MYGMHCALNNKRPTRNWATQKKNDRTDAKKMERSQYDIHRKKTPIPSPDKWEGP